MSPVRPARRGTVMVIVLGLIAIMLGLLLTITASVHLGIRGLYDYQANVQYFIDHPAACPPSP